MSTDLEAVLEDFIVARHEDIAKAEGMLRVLRHGPGPEQGDLFDDPRRCRRAKAVLA